MTQTETVAPTSEAITLAVMVPKAHTTPQVLARAIRAFLAPTAHLTVPLVLMAPALDMATPVLMVATRLLVLMGNSSALVMIQFSLLTFPDLMC